MKNNLILFAAGCIFGAALVAFWPQSVKEPATKNITISTYEAMFRPTSFNAPRLNTVHIVVNPVETRVDTVRVPVARNRDDLRLFYGDLTIDRNQVTLGTFNPNTATWSAQVFDIPAPRFTHDLTIQAGWPQQIELSTTLRHRSGFGLFARGGYLFQDPFFGIGLSYTF